jgi:hypothetical protein
MASLIYDSCLRDLQIGAIDSDADTFKAMLVTSSYTPNKGTHAKRSDVTNEVTGTGYTAGGVTCACTPALNTTTHVMVLTFAAVSWATSTITARGMVIYKSRSGSSSADELVGYLDFNSNISSAGGTFSVAASTLTTTNS